MDDSALTPDPARPGTAPGTPPATRHGSAGGPDREIEHEPTDRPLDPEVEARVQALLADAPDPGPMPDHVADRIMVALADAARVRDVARPIPTGPLPTGAARQDDADPDGTVVPMPTRAGRPRPLYLVAAVAAAALVVTVGASALHATKRPNGAAAVGYSSRPAATTGTTGTTGRPADRADRGRWAPRTSS